MAHNLAFSIKKHNPALKIGLWIDPTIKAALPDHKLFSDIRDLPTQYFQDHKGRVDPAKAKTKYYELGLQMADKFMFLDVDGICMADMQPILDHLDGSTFSTEVVGKGGRNDAIHYSPWVSNETMWATFDLKPNAILCGIQSSWMYYERSKFCDTMQQHLDYHMAIGVPKNLLLIDWGGTLPDELIYQGVCAKLGVIPSMPIHAPRTVVFFGDKFAKATLQEVRDNYYVLALYGHRLVQKQYLKLADTLMREYGDPYGYTTEIVMKDKHAKG